MQRAAVSVLLMAALVSCQGGGDASSGGPDSEASVAYWALQTCDVVGRGFGSLLPIGLAEGDLDGPAFEEHRDRTSQRAAIVAGSYEGLVLGLEEIDRPIFVSDFHETLTDDFSRLRDVIEQAAEEFPEAESQVDIDRIRSEFLSVEEELIRVANTKVHSLPAEAFAELRSRSGCDPFTTG